MTSSDRRPARPRRLAPAVLMSSLVAGCSDGKPPVETSRAEVTVSGKVTLRGKPAGPGHKVIFDPSNFGRPDVMPKEAEIKDGSYTITTLIGTNTVRVQGPVASKIPGIDYTPMVFEADPDKTTFDITLPPPTPAGEEKQAGG